MSFPQSVSSLTPPPPPTQLQMDRSHWTAYMGWSEVGQTMAKAVQRSTGGQNLLTITGREAGGRGGGGRALGPGNATSSSNKILTPDESVEDQK